MPCVTGTMCISNQRHFAEHRSCLTERLFDNTLEFRFLSFGEMQRDISRAAHRNRVGKEKEAVDKVIVSDHDLIVHLD